MKNKRQLTKRGLNNSRQLTQESFPAGDPGQIREIFWLKNLPFEESSSEDKPFMTLGKSGQQFTDGPDISPDRAYPTGSLQHFSQNRPTQISKNSLTERIFNNEE